MPEITSQFSEHNSADVLRPLSELQKVDHIVNKTYLSGLDKLPICQCPEDLNALEVSETACLFPVDRVVYDRNESNQKKLAGVWSGAAIAGINIAMLIDGSKNDIKLYLGAWGEKNRLKADEQVDILYRSLTGSFPGIRSEGAYPVLNKARTAEVVDGCISDYKAICSVSGIASANHKSEEKNTAFTQGIEKVVEAMNGTKFSVIMLARSLTDETLLHIKEGYEQLYTQLFPYAKFSQSVSKNVSESISKTLGNTLTDSVSYMSSHSFTTGHSSSNTVGGGVCFSQGSSIGGSFGIGPSALDIGTHKSIGLSLNISQSETKSESETDANSVTEGQTLAVTNSQGETVTLALGRTYQLNYEDKTVLEILDRIEQHLKRLRYAEGTGMFAMAAYFLAEDLPTAKAAASTYKAIISGDATGIEKIAINSWTKGYGMEHLLPYVKKLCHPIFYLDPHTTVTPASVVTADELAVHINFPKSSISGIPVDESVSYGMNVIRLDSLQRPDTQLTLGDLFHLGRKMGRPVRIPLESLKSHVLIAGTTGSGKSNTIYQLLLALYNLDKAIHIMVIEPTKGDYKKDLSDFSDLKIYGTNPMKSPLLRLDPFYFPEDTHVLEHLDRLVDLFNVCWPMYAAMPAVLKNACERAYQAAGWNLSLSANQYGVRLFPTFSDVMREVKGYMEESAYSADNKSDYTGSLVTRLSSLTTGLNAQMLTSNGLTDEMLFENNVIIDLSRLGSVETKALIMGLLVIRLQEYRAAAQQSKNPLRHVTVLEEAHHLLKRTSFEQQMEGANLAGRSVEMLANILAEVRAGGEGIIIADQSPGALDPSAIKNTNTKIVLRLYDQNDRESVGRAMGMNQEQINELAKLPDGVAAVYQSNWRETVLVKVPLYETSSKPYHYCPADDEIFHITMEEELANALIKRDLEAWIEKLGNDPIQKILSLQLNAHVKGRLIEYQRTELPLRISSLARVAYDYFNCGEAFSQVEKVSDSEEKIKILRSLILPPNNAFTERDIDTFFRLLTREHGQRDVRNGNFYAGHIKER